MIVSLWPTLVSISNSGFSFAELEQLRVSAEAAHAKYSRGREIWERSPHNLFEDASFEAIKALFIQRVTEVCGGRLPEVEELACREIIRVPGQEILPHADRYEGDLSAHIFLSGESLSSSDITPFSAAEINQYCDNAFSLCDPARLGMDKRLPWESFYNFWVKPHLGMFVVYPSNLLHFQRPFVGTGKFVQLTMFMRFKRGVLEWEHH